MKFKKYSRKDKIKLFLLYNAYFGAILYVVTGVPLRLATTLDMFMRYGIDFNPDLVMLNIIGLGIIFVMFIAYLGSKEIARVKTAAELKVSLGLNKNP